jgi:hypothetical protein
MRRPQLQALPPLLLVVALETTCKDDERHEHPEGIGNYCEQDADCPTDECYLGPGGGYCTSACAVEGDESECPEDTVCKPIQGGARRCLLICGSDSACDEHDDCQEDYCPDGSSCVDVGNTEHLACEPDP